jgi:hypothetical protein
MSLDVFLYDSGDGTEIRCECTRCGNVHSYNERRKLYSANITHNIATMAGRAGIYDFLWRPDEININKASQLTYFLRNGLALLKTNPEYFKKFNPENGWGDYDGLVSFVENYLAACIEYPDADVEVSR